MNVSRLDEFKRIDVTGREAASFAEHCVNMGTAYGLALQGVGLGQIDINLVPSSILREQAWHNKMKWFVVAASILVVGSAMTLLGPFMQERQLGSDGVPVLVNQVINKGEKLKRDFNEAEKNGRIGDDAAQLLSLFHYRDVWPYIVHDTADALAAADPTNRSLSLSELLDQYPNPESRPLVRLRDLSGTLYPSQNNQPSTIQLEVQIDLSHANPIIFLEENIFKMVARSHRANWRSCRSSLQNHYRLCQT